MGIISNSLISINNVLFVDGLKHNLLSISKFYDNGHEILFNKNLCSVINTSDKYIVFKGKRKGNMYKVNLSNFTLQKVVCLLSISDEKWV